MPIFLLLCNALQVPNEMGAQYHDVLSGQDVAVYGGLCALASFDRSELQNHVINNVSFRDYMEVNPEVVPLSSQSKPQQLTSYAAWGAEPDRTQPHVLHALTALEGHCCCCIYGLNLIGVATIATVTQ